MLTTPHGVVEIATAQQKKKQHDGGIEVRDGERLIGSGSPATLNLSAQNVINVVNNELAATVPYGVTTFVGVNDQIFANGFQ